MKGRRIDTESWTDIKPGDYGFYEGNWWAYPPRQDAGPVCLTREPVVWNVVEHEDKTITVSPSINVIGRWHGFLKQGEWREC